MPQFKMGSADAYDEVAVRLEDQFGEMAGHDPVGPFEDALNSARSDVDFVERHVSTLQDGFRGVLDRVARDDDATAVFRFQFEFITPRRMAGSREKANAMVKLSFPANR